MTIGEMLDASKEEGKIEGRAEGALEICIQLIKKGILTPEQAATQLGMSKEELENLYK